MRCATSLFAVHVRVLGACAFALATCGIAVHAQKVPDAAGSGAPVQSETPKDRLGRSTPRGTVKGFLDAARAGEHGLAAQYLNARPTRAEPLARELFVVLDARLPARLMQISDEPEGSLTARTPMQEIVGTIETRNGNVDIVLERIQRVDSGSIWLFSAATLDAVPALHEEIVSSRNAIVPDVLTSTRIGGVRLFDFLAVLVGLPLLYLATVLLNRLLTSLIRLGLHRIARESQTANRNVLPAPARLLLVTFAAGALVSVLPLSLAVRQLWSNSASILTVTAVAWLLFLLTGEIEQRMRRRLPPSNTAAVPLLRLLRRAVDTLVVFGAVIAMLRLRGIDPTPALAGLGVGGIAVALAAQKTLENVVAGASLIFDQAVRVGDFLKFGDVLGTVDHIGLRSTRIRTLDRTVVSVPNGQIASVSLETLSSRDKFWFHPVVGLCYETTPDQLHSVIDGIRRLLEEHSSVDLDSVRVRFFRLGSFSLDVDVFAYVRAPDWNRFLEIQEQLLFAVTEIVSRSGTSIAFPSQTMYLANHASAVPDTLPLSMR